ncbi:MAG: hypothetical protein ACOC1X_03070 [Promethearchaeota archaeon]
MFRLINILEGLNKEEKDFTELVSRRLRKYGYRKDEVNTILEKVDFEPVYYQILQKRFDRCS